MPQLAANPSSLKLLAEAWAGPDPSTSNLLIQYLVCQNHCQGDWRHHFLNILHFNTQHGHSQLPMTSKSIKASKVFQKRSKAKVIEWVPWKHSQGTWYTPVEVSTSSSQQTPRQDTVIMETDNNEDILHENNPPSMDVNETFWIDEPVIPEQWRVSHQ